MSRAVPTVDARFSAFALARHPHHRKAIAPERTQLEDPGTGVYWSSRAPDLGLPANAGLTMLIAVAPEALADLEVLVHLLASDDSTNGAE